MSDVGFWKVSESVTFLRTDTVQQTAEQTFTDNNYVVENST